MNLVRDYYLIKVCCPAYPIVRIAYLFGIRLVISVYIAGRLRWITKGDLNKEKE
jgi:hypothetical protein